MKTVKTRRTWRQAGERPESRRAARLGRSLAVAAGSLRGRAGWAAGSAAVLVLGLVAVWLFLGGEKSGPPDPRARQYKEFDACLLTDDKGILAGTPAAPVWEGMQQASQDTRARVNYVPVMGEQSAENARPFFNSLMQRQCDVVLAVGTPQVEVTEAGAKQHPKVRFVVVDGAEKAGNVTVAKSGDGLKETVAEAIRQAVKASEG
ncbi:BMP family ABC transporter substrate-binding protein [Streptomyces lunaelactis]|uniref:BMP family ABC transporter substrate-binding protein n=1 Tax=Streptomyces lunaelactis TaxID=1535768 RepID=UPI0028160022|nr:BMP family ABC transporter substrate-binding protein [Streptomyces lunaelactis]